MSAVLNRLEEETNLLGICKDMLSHVRILFRMPAYVCRCTTSQLSQNPLRNQQKGILMKKEYLRMSQRLVASSYFSKPGWARLASVTVKAGLDG